MFVECVLEEGKKVFKKYDMNQIAGFKASLRPSDYVAVDGKHTVFCKTDRRFGYQSSGGQSDAISSD